MCIRDRNYILDQMHTHGVTYAEALADAQKLGFAEADPTADVEGHDAAAKAAILASLAFHTRVTFDDVACEGISSITAGDIAAAKEMGCVIKLLARCAKADDGSVAVGVHPTMVPLEHPLASVSGAFNAVFVELEWADKLMFMGPGAVSYTHLDVYKRQAREPAVDVRRHEAIRGSDGDDPRAGRCDRHPQRRQGVLHEARVPGVQDAGQGRGAVGERGQHEGARRRRLGTGNDDAGRDRTGGGRGHPPPHRAASAVTLSLIHI